MNTCQTLRADTPQERQKIIKSQHGWISCLGTHEIKNVNQKFSISKCQRKHRTVLHFDQTCKENLHVNLPSISVSKPSKGNSNNFIGLSTDYSPTHTNSTVLLATVMVKLKTTLYSYKRGHLRRNETSRSYCQTFYRNNYFKFAKLSLWSMYKLIQVFSYVLRCVGNLKRPLQRNTDHLSSQ